MQKLTFRRATRVDAPRLNEALRQLSEAMGDTHGTSDPKVAEAGFGPKPAFLAMLAERDTDIVGAAVYSSLFSTTQGRVGVYLSDLWVDPGLRGQQLGVRLLAAVRDDAHAEWGAEFVRLAVYHDNARAKAFYLRLGFVPATGETSMTLDSKGLMTLEEGL